MQIQIEDYQLEIKLSVRCNGRKYGVKLEEAIPSLTSTSNQLPADEDAVVDMGQLMLVRMAQAVRLKLEDELALSESRYGAALRAMEWAPQL
jgi:hypothetical protein